MNNGFLTTLQLSMIGVVMVCGLYFLWLSVQRVEMRIKAVDERFAAFISQSEKALYMDSEEAARQAIEAMASMGRTFDDEFMFTNGVEIHEMDDEGETEETQQTAAVATASVAAAASAATAASAAASAASATTPSAVPAPSSVSDQDPSKNKLTKLTADALRSILEIKGLPTEGPKTTLIQRILSVE